jgi:hypothetical protein
MHLDHTATSYMKQLFVVWGGDELTALELIAFLETVANRVFCIVRLPFNVQAHQRWVNP